MTGFKYFSVGPLANMRSKNIILISDLDSFDIDYSMNIKYKFFFIESLSQIIMLLFRLRLLPP